MSTKYSIISYIVLIIIFSTTLLIGYRFDALWAGGQGISPHQLAVTADRDYKRGEIIETGDDEWLPVRFGNVDLWLSENTQVKLIDGRVNNLTVNVLQGRIVVNGPITIEVREIDIQVDGLATYVHYSWLDEAEIVNIAGSVLVEREDRIIQVDQGLKTTTLAPFSEEVIQFDPETSEAADFYAQALQ